MRLLAEKARAFDSLDHLILGVSAPRIVHDDPVMAPTIACWSLVHGACLMLDGGFGHQQHDQAPVAKTLLPAMLKMLDVPN